MSACKEIEEICNQPGSPSKCYRCGPEYDRCISHYFQSSCEIAKLAVEPGTVTDLINIMNVLKKYKAPFAVKCGGHTSNPHFSSTTNIHISMAQFNGISYHDNDGTVAIGAGCRFEDVYKYLSGRRPGILGRNIVGGENPVGVGGWLLGGGYSMKTNRFGLGMDNVEAYKIVVPGEVNASARLVTVKRTDVEREKKDLFWALKGGGNNFGIVTEFTLATHDQPADSQQDFFLVYDTLHAERVKGAILTFLEESDNRTTIKAYFEYDHTPDGIKFQLRVNCFYDKDLAHPERSPFAEFLGIPHHTQSAFPARKNDLGRWGCVMLQQYTPEILNTVDEQAKAAAGKMPEHNGKRFTICCKPFGEHMFDGVSDDYAENGAWPHRKGEPNHPLVVFAEWEGKQNDDFWISEMERVLDVLSAKIKASALPVYPNTALAGYTTVKDVYPHNLERLIQIRDKVDPEKVMTRAGGFKIPEGI